MIYLECGAGVRLTLLSSEVPARARGGQVSEVKDGELKGYAVRTGTPGSFLCQG